MRIHYLLTEIWGEHSSCPKSNAYKVPEFYFCRQQPSFLFFLSFPSLFFLIFLFPSNFLFFSSLSKAWDADWLKNLPSCFRSNFCFWWISTLEVQNHDTVSITRQLISILLSTLSKVKHFLMVKMKFNDFCCRDISSLHITWFTWPF